MLKNLKDLMTKIDLMKIFSSSFFYLTLIFNSFYVCVLLFPLSVSISFFHSHQETTSLPPKLQITFLEILFQG